MKAKSLLLAFFVISITVSISSWAQNESGHLSYYTYAQSLQFQRQYYTSPANYFQYSTIIDANGNLYSLVVDNYELHCFTKQNDSEEWQKELIPTGHDGDIYIAFIGLTGNNQRVIAYSYNPYFNYGAATPYGYEFWCTTVILIETNEGWVEKVYFTQPQDSWSYNYGLIPFAINSDVDGTVHLILHRRGWYNYGGSLYEVIVDYSNNQANWGEMTQIHVYSEGTIDRGTSWVGRQVIKNDEQHLVYYKQAPASGTYYIDYALKSGGVWQQPTRLRTTTKGNYHYFDLDMANDGNYYFMYIENNEPDGPTIWLCKNGIDLNTSFMPFETGDVTIKANLFPLDDGSARVLVFLKDKHPKIFEYDGLTLTELDPLTFDNTQASDLFIGKSFVPIPNYAMLNDGVNAMGFSSDNVSTSSSGDVTTYYQYDRLFVEVDWQGVPSSTNNVKVEKINIYPNPASESIRLSNVDKGSLINVYNINGELVKSIVYETEEINIGDLPVGMYVLNVGDVYLKFIKL